MSGHPSLPGATRVATTASRGGELRRGEDWAAEEVPVALQYNGLSHAVMLASPLDLEDFAMGFSLSEGLIDSPADLFGVEVQPGAQGIVIDIEIASRCLARLKERRRTLAGRTGCGLCGVDSLAEAVRPPTGHVNPVRMEAAALGRAMRQLQAAQPLQAATGATHAAAWCTSDGRLRLLREDVGRHNALDKLVGALARQQLPGREGFIAVTSRASYEMVHKTAQAGVGLLAAISAPTALAVRHAAQAGMCLVGFTRSDDWVAYSHADRLLTSLKVAP
jgi:FdhD protein